MSWDVVLFDLDGTLTDSGLGVGNGVLYTLEKMGYPKPSDAELKKYLGPPLWTSFQDYAGMPESDTPEAVRLYREYYNETGAYENSVYSGIPELLKKLNDDGKRLAVATSKVDCSAPPERGSFKDLQFKISIFIPTLYLKESLSSLWCKI
jgi:phosphoglycolate phosphatase